jgi:signal peptidase I
VFKKVFGFVERSLAVAGLCFIVFHLGFGLSEIVSDSMSPTLQGDAGEPDNDVYLYERISTRFGAPSRQSLVVFEDGDGVRIAKRVVGLPGESLRIKDSQLEVNGTLLPPPAEGVRYLRAGKLRPRRDKPETYTVPEGTVFVLGDNSRDSYDSRFYGGLEEKRWRGRAVAVVWPPSRWSWVW